MMIRFIASSKYVARQLQLLTEDRPTYVVADFNGLHIHNTNSSVTLNVNDMQGTFDKRLSVENRRFDFLLQSLMGIPDQPIVIQITETELQLTCTY